MTTQTISCYALTIPTAAPTPVINQVTGTAAVLPANNVITEVSVQLRTAVALAPDGGQSFNIGLIGGAIEDYVTITVASINADNYVEVVNETRHAITDAAYINIQSTAALITAGAINLIIKYKPIAIGDRKL